MNQAEEKEFYNLMQDYRHAVSFAGEDSALSRAYAAVKDFVSARKAPQTAHGDVVALDPCIDRPMCSHCKGTGVEPVFDASRRVVDGAGNSVE